MSSHIYENRSTKTSLIEAMCGRNDVTDVWPVYKNIWFSPPPWIRSTPVAGGTELEIYRLRSVLLLGSEKQGHCHGFWVMPWWQQTSLPLRRIYITRVQGRWWPVRFPSSTCPRNAFCSLPTGLHPGDLWETRCAQEDSESEPLNQKKKEMN